MSTPEAHTKLRSEFDRLIELSVPERALALEQIRASDPALAAELADLLRDAPLPEVIRAAEARDQAAPGEKRCGPFELLEPLGSGGMGTVYKAIQRHPFPRTVAVKILSLPRPSPRLLARFDMEREALARLDHPNIAHVLDAGVSDANLPYIAMEFIEGTSITQYVRTHQPRLEETLGLMVKVCRAVQHAHDRGVLHRDIKPSNILVARVDGVATPKLIDLGITRLFADLDADARMTRQGEIVGTPEYMSPEQADAAERDIDVRTDVYSLGVVLYELMSGQLPIASETLRGVGNASLAGTIRTARVVPPSRTRVAGSLSDLDVVVLKAMSTDRASRYASARELAEDLERVVRYEPVLAHAPSRIYRLRKFARRHALPLAAAGLVAASLLGGLAFALVGWREARGSERMAKEAQADSEKFASYMREVLWTSDPMCLGPSATMRDSMARSFDRFWDHPPESAAVRARVALVVARPLAMAGDQERAEKALLLAIQEYTTHPAARGVNTFESLRMAYTALGLLREEQGRLREAMDLRVKAVDAARKAGPNLNLGSALVYLALSLKDSGDMDGAVRLQHEIIQIADQSAKDGRVKTEAKLQLLWTYTACGRWQEALELGTPLIEQRRALNIANDTFLMNIMTETGRAALELGKLDLAESLLRGGLEVAGGAGHQEYGALEASALLCKVKSRRGETAAAADELESLLAPLEEAAEGPSEALITCLPVLVELQVAAGRLESARKMCDSVCASTKSMKMLQAATTFERLGKVMGPALAIHEQSHLFTMASEKLSDLWGEDHPAMQRLTQRVKSELAKRDPAASESWQPLPASASPAH